MAGPVLSEPVPVTNQPPSLDFIYVNANVGEASGGHTALRLGQTVFHYQFYENGNFFLVRETWNHFRFVYNELCNRSIFISSLPLDLPIYDKLRHHFTKILLVQQQTLRRLDESKTQLKFIENLRGEQKVQRLSGLGLFDCSRSGDFQAEKLRNEIETSLGKNFLGRETERVRRKLELVGAFFDNEQPIKLFMECLELREALQVLTNDQPVAKAAIIMPLKNEVSLTLTEREYLQQHKVRLRTSIVGLLRSSRPDRGAALLLQIARYQTVQRSLTNNWLLSLDPFSEKALLKPVTNDEVSSGMLQHVYSQLLNEVLTQRAFFFTETDRPEMAYSFLETRRARLYELDQALRGSETRRVEPDPLTPSRSSEISLVKFAFDPIQLQMAAAKLKQSVQSQQQLIKKEYSYNLVEQNCATKLLDSLNSAFESPTVGRRALGGHLEYKQNLTFVPFIFYGQAQANLSLNQQECLLSRRLRKLHNLNEEEGGLKNWLRESNTFTSTLYEPRSEDTPFLFFTDDARLARPLEGVVNFGYAALHGTVGILTLPFDGGKRFHQGLRGMFYSLPELFFWNIRKGSYGSADLSAATARP